MMNNDLNIQWYPGHMAKALKEVTLQAKLVDLVIILLDARIPLSSFNPLFEEAFRNKRVMYVMTKSDKADDFQTNQWLKYFENDKKKVLAIDARKDRNIKKVIIYAEELMKEKREKDALRGLKPRPIKTMIIGIPNVGKSTLINALVKKRVANVGDRPGITKQQQWIRINQFLDLLDTPGILWPKFENQEMAMRLAITGAIKDNINNVIALAEYLISDLQISYPNALKRYPIDQTLSPKEFLEKLMNYVDVGSTDLTKTAQMVIQDFRENRLGRITLDRFQDEYR